MPADKKVAFERSRGAGSKSHRQRASDSGVGSFSDQDSLAANPDRTFTAQDYEEQSYSIAALQEALASSRAECDRLKATFKQADHDLVKARKDLRELDGRWKVQLDANEDLEKQKAQLLQDKRLLQRQVDELHTVIEAMRASPPREREPSPKMTGALGEEQPRPRLQRRESKREKHRDDKHKDDRHREEKLKDEKRREEKEKDRLSKRFESKDEPQSPSATSSHTRSRYIEPFGGGGRPTSSIVSQPPQGRVVRSYSGYAASGTQPPVFSSMQQPTYSNIPRSEPPVSPYHDAFYPEDVVYAPGEDGNYHAFPLPAEPRKHRR